MSSRETLLNCFSFLEKDLFKIEHYKPDTELPFQHHAINSIVAQVSESDYEDSLQFLYRYQERIADLLSKVPTRIESLEIKDKFLNWDDQFKPAQEIKEELKATLIDRLMFYQEELKKIVDSVESNLDKLGPSRFAAAGFRLRLNLPHQEIAFFFRALVETKALTKEDGKEPTNTELAKFISANFASANKDSIAISNLVNLLSRNTDYSKDIETLFKKWAAHVK